MATSSKVVDNGSSRKEIVQALRELDEDADDYNEIFARHVTQPMTQRFQFRRLHKHVLTADPVQKEELKKIGFNACWSPGVYHERTVVARCDEQLYVASRMAANRITHMINPNHSNPVENVCVINVTNPPLKGAINLCESEVIHDHDQLHPWQALNFLSAGAKKIEDAFLCNPDAHVVVACSAGCNRSVAVCLYYLICTKAQKFIKEYDEKNPIRVGENVEGKPRTFRWANPSKLVQMMLKHYIIEPKSEAAAYYRVKNRHQTFKRGFTTTDKYSWPSLFGGGAPAMRYALERVAELELSTNEAREHKPLVEESFKDWKHPASSKPSTANKKRKVTFNDF